MNSSEPFDEYRVTTADGRARFVSSLAVVEVIRPLAGDMEDTAQRLQGIYTYLAGTAAALLAVCVVVLVIGKRRQYA